MKMKGYAMLGIGKTGWIEKEVPECGPLDAIVRPLAVSPCTSDVHTVWEGAIGDRRDMILGHEAVGEIVEVGKLVKDLKTGDKVIVPAITPDWGSLEAQGGYSMHSGGMLAGWKFSNFKDGVFAEYFHVNEADANLARLPDGVNVADAVMLSDMVPTGFHGRGACPSGIRRLGVRRRHRSRRTDGGGGVRVEGRGQAVCGRLPPQLRGSGEILRRDGHYQL